MSPKNPEQFNQEKVDILPAEKEVAVDIGDVVIDVESKPVKTGPGETGKNLGGETKIEHPKTKPEGEKNPPFDEYIKKQLEIIEEKQKKGEELSGAEKVIWAKTAERRGETLVTLNDRKKEVEEQLSKTEDKKEKERLLEEKRKISDEIIEKASGLLGRDLAKEIEEEKEEQWKKSIAASGYKSMDGYKEWHKKNYCIEVVKNSSLSEEQKEDLLSDGFMVVSNWPKTIELTVEDVAVALKKGLDISQIKGKGRIPFVSKKIVADGRLFDSINDFNKFLAKESEALIDPEVQEKMEQRKKEIIEKGASDAIVDDKIKKAMDLLFKKENSPAKAEQKNIPEKQTTETEPLSVTERLALLSDLRSSWKSAEKIDQALKTGKDLKINDKETLDLKMKLDVIEEMRGVKSDDIIDIAEKLTGRNLKKEAIIATGYGLDKKPKKQKEYQRWLTDEVKKIFETNVAQIEKETGKKVRITSKKQEVEQEELDMARKALEKAYGSKESSVIVNTPEFSKESVDVNTTMPEKKRLSETNERGFRSGIRKGKTLPPLRRVRKEKTES